MNNLIPAINNINFKRKILVVGDVILDQYQYCHSTRLTPDENKPIYDVDHSVYCLGGAANVARNLSSLGAEVSLIGLVGSDYQATVLHRLLSDAHINSDYVLVDPTRSTSSKTRIINNDSFLFRIDNENKIAICQEYQNKVQTIINKVSDEFDACIISDYQKGLLVPNLCQFIISSFIKINRPVFVDPKGDDYSKYRNSTVITPNQKELEIISGKKFGKDVGKMQQAGIDLYEQINCQNVVVTVGSKGMIHINKTETLHSPAFNAPKINASGAGDTAISFIALSFLSGLNWRKILSVSNYFCSLVIQKPYTSVIDISLLN